MIVNVNANVDIVSPNKSLTLNHIFQGQGIYKFMEIHKGITDFYDKLNLTYLITLNENFCFKVSWEL